MISQILITITIMGWLHMAFYTPYSMCLSTFIMKDGAAYNKEKLLSAIPYVNSFMSGINYDGTILYGISKVIFSVLIGVRVVSMFYAMSTVSTIITVLLFLIGIAGLLISDMLFVFRVLNDSKQYSILKTIMLSILFPLGQFEIGTFLIKMSMAKESSRDIF